jgi:hypothetical protein
MSFRILIEGSKHDWKDSLDIVADKIAKVLIVPEVERTFRNLNQELDMTSTL